MSARGIGAAGRLALALLAVAGCAPAAARAEYTAPQLLSATGRLQADAGSVALSGDGRYGVFTTFVNRITSAPVAPDGQNWIGGGLYRRALAGGEPELVAPLSIVDLADPLRGGDLNGAASVSADGRFVAFSTTAGLAPQDTNGVSDVYVRDLSRGYFDDGAFTLVSAADGSDDPLTYDGDPSVAVHGSVASASAMSADGQRVAFTVNDGSDLDGAGTAPGQVAVRDLGAHSTALVSRPLGDGLGAPGNQPREVHLSADGTTVAWITPNVRAQVALPADADRAFPLDTVPQLLWRRIADGAGAVTRVAIGPADPDDPRCGGGTPTYAVTPGPCDGPVAIPDGDLNGGVAQFPTVDHFAMTADGRTLIADAGPNRESFVLQPSGAFNSVNAFTQLFAVDMTPGLTRKSAATPLGFVANAGVAVTADGNQVIAAGAEPLTFSLLSHVGPFPVNPLITQNAYAIDRGRRTIELLSRGFAGDAGDGKSSAPAVSADGRAVAFLSEAKNLVYGDANAAQDAFTVGRVDRSDLPAPVLLPQAQPAPVVPVPWRIDATASSLRSGTVRLTVKVPAAGRLTASSTATPGPVRARKGKALKVATGKAASTGAATVTLALRPAKAARKYARTKAGLRSAVALTFKATTGRTLKARVTLTFRIRSAKKAAR